MSQSSVSFVSERSPSERIPDRKLNFVAGGGLRYVPLTPKGQAVSWGFNEEAFINSLPSKYSLATTVFLSLGGAIG